VLNGQPLSVLGRGRLLGLLTLAALLVMGVFAAVAHAANPVSGLTVDPLTPSNAGLARTDYVIHFTTSATGALASGQHITITLPPSSNAATIVNAVVTDTTTSTQVGTCGVSSQTVEVCTISSGKTVTAGDHVTVELDGVTNPPQNPTGGQQPLSVVTDTDTTTATTNYTVGSAGSVSTPSVVNSSPSTAAGARTDYVITFNASGTGGMSGTAHSQITITFPGTATSPFNTTTIVNAIVTDTTTSTQVGTCGVSSQTVEVCTISSGKTVTAGDTLTVELDGVTTESPAPVKLADLLTVSTTSDVNTITSNPYPVANAGTISTPTVTNSSPTTAAGARTDYLISFTTSGTGGMSGTAHSQITITFPGTATSPFNTTTIVNAIVTDTTTSTQVGTCGVSSQTVEVCTISSGKTVTAGDTLTVELDGVTTESPAPVKLADLLTVSTTSDVNTITSNPYPVANGGAITAPRVDNSSPSTAAGARTDYLITFNTSGTGGMSGTAHSQITITFPGTATSPFNTTTIVNAIVTDTTTSTQVGTCGVSSQTVEVCTISSGKTVAAGDRITVELDGVTTESPAPNGNLDTLTVSTTSDTATMTSVTFPVATAGTITTPTVQLSNLTPSAAANYTILFDTSGTGGMTGTAHSQITITLPATSSTLTITNAVVTDAGVQVGTCGVSSQTVQVCTIASGKAVNPGDQVTISLSGVTNPSNVSTSSALTVQTTSDTTTATSSPYQGPPQPPSVTGISPASGPTSGGTGVTITGTNLTGATAVRFGSSAATNIIVVSSTQITATSPAGSGTVDVTVTTPAGTSSTSAADQYAYLAAPIVTQVNPAAGPTGGGTSITITGTGLAGATAVRFGLTNATNFAVNSGTKITATAPAGTVGTVDITVTTPGGTSTTSAADQYTYAAAPTVTGVSPITGPAAGGTSVTIAGTNLAGATAVKFGTVSATITTDTATGITATAPAGSAATVDVTVTTPGGTSATSAADQYTYVAAPAVTQVAPTAGPTAGGTVVTITGTNLTGATAVKFGSTNATNFAVNSATKVTATAPAGNAGTVDVTVTSPAGTSATSATDQYTYAAQPTVKGLNPTSGPATGGTTVTITGTNFTTGDTVKFGATNAPGVIFISATSITATSPVGAVGTVDVTVTTPGGTSLTSPVDQYTYTALPTVTGINPTSGPASGGTTVTITGTNFSRDATVKFGSANGLNTIISSTTSMTATAPAGTAGTVDVTVTTGSGTSTTSPADQYTYTTPQPGAPPPSAPPLPSSSPPAVSGGAPAIQTSTTGGVSGSVNPENLATTAFFQYGLDPSERGPGPSTTLYDQSTPVQQVGSDDSSHPVSAALTGLVPGALYHIRLVANNSAGTTFGPDQTFTTPQAPAPPPPVLGQSENAQPVSGTVFIRLPSGAFVRLTGAEKIPSGAEIDALHGSLQITTATAKKGKTQKGVFGGAVFKLTQARAGANKGLATLSLVEGAFKGAPSYALCTKHKAGDPSATTASVKTLQLLHASAHGKFRTKGRYSAATVLGTIWTTADRCDGTLVHDITDSVSVTDFVHHKTIIIHAGQSYLAKKP